MSTVFYGGTDWEGSSEPMLTRQIPPGDMWPHGAASEIGGGAKDVLEDGLHPILAIGAKAERPDNLVGVVITYDADALLAQVNIGKGFISKQYVSNILTYAAGSPATFAATFAAFTPVYIDDSADLAEGVTLSLSPLNSAGSGNPLAGYIMYGQSDYLDAGVGGANAAAGLPVAADNGEQVVALLNIMLA